MSRARIVTSPDIDDERVLTVNVFLDAEAETEGQRSGYQYKIRDQQQRDVSNQEELRNDEIQEIKRLIKRMRDSNSKEPSPESLHNHRYSGEFREPRYHQRPSIDSKHHDDFRSPPQDPSGGPSNRKIHTSQLDTWGKKEMESNDRRTPAPRPSNTTTPRDKPHITVTAPPSATSNRIESKRSEDIPRKRQPSYHEEEDSVDTLPPKHLSTEPGDPMPAKKSNRSMRTPREDEPQDPGRSDNRSEKVSKTPAPSVPRMNLPPPRPSTREKQTLTEDFFEILNKPKTSQPIVSTATQTTDRFAPSEPKGPKSYRPSLKDTEPNEAKRDHGESGRRSHDSVEALKPKSVSAFRQEQPQAASKVEESKQTPKKVKSSTSRKTSVSQVVPSVVESRLSKSPSVARSKAGKKETGGRLSASEMQSKTPRKRESEKRVGERVGGKGRSGVESVKKTGGKRGEGGTASKKKKKVGGEAGRREEAVWMEDGQEESGQSGVAIKPSESRSRSPPRPSGQSFVLTPLQAESERRKQTLPMEREVFDRQNEVIRHLQEEKEVLERMIAKLIHDNQSRSVSREANFNSPNFKPANKITATSPKKPAPSDEMQSRPYNHYGNDTFRNRSPPRDLENAHLHKPAYPDRAAVPHTEHHPLKQASTKKLNQSTSSLSQNKPLHNHSRTNRRSQSKENVPPQGDTRKSTLRKTSPKSRQEETSRRLMQGSPPRCLKFEAANQRTVKRTELSPPRTSLNSSPSKLHHYSPTRPLPFDVDPRLQKTEWELKQPMMSRLDRVGPGAMSFGGFPSRAYSIERNEGGPLRELRYQRNLHVPYTPAHERVEMGGRNPEMRVGEPYMAMSPKPEPIYHPRYGERYPAAPASPPGRGGNCAYCEELDRYQGGGGAGTGNKRSRMLECRDCHRHLDIPGQHYHGNPSGRGAGAYY